jgi:spermidine/putrescine-binding protein
MYNLHRERADIRFAIAQEGTILYIDYVCVLSQSKHPEVAFAFVNHLLDPHVAAEISNFRMLPMPNEDARRLLEGDGRSMWGLFETLRTHNRTYETLRDVGPAQPAYEQAWKNIKDSYAAQQKTLRANPNSH